jgi:hypothetical protein
VLLYEINDALAGSNANFYRPNEAMHEMRTGIHQDTQSHMQHLYTFSFGPYIPFPLAFAFASSVCDSGDTGVISNASPLKCATIMGEIVI